MEELFITICVIGFTLTVLSPYFFNRYTKFKLEIEKMRIESELRKEEIRAKNQFDIEKYMADEQLKAGRMQAKAANAGAPAGVGGETFVGSGVSAASQYQRSSDTQQAPAAFGTQPDFGSKPEFGTQPDFRTQPDFDDIGTRSYVNSSGVQETDLGNDGRGREKLKY
jgi:hypothetical protein